MLFSKLIFASFLMFSGFAFSSHTRGLDPAEKSILNYALDCPTEIKEILNAGGQWVGDGVYRSDRHGSGYILNFYKQVGFTMTEYVGTVYARRKLRLPPLPADAPSYTIECRLSYEGEE